jgi:hypothetical protein
MMKKVLQITMLLCLFAISSFAQTAIPNASFETWVSSDQPTSWSSNAQGTGYASDPGATCSQSHNAHSGNYSAQVKTISYIGTVVNGSLTTGRVNAPDFTKADGYISDIVATS